VNCAESLSEEGIRPRLFWYNPNIHPFTEYRARRDTLVRYAAAAGLELEMLDVYGLRTFLRGAAPYTETGGNGRCGFCYRVRLETAARFAAEQGFDHFSSTLLISPYQDHEGIRLLGEKLARTYHTAFLYRDFRPRFRDGQNKARAMGLYMQKYCGCIFSEEERYLKTRESAVS
jgi:predicted adenine nucleotide alpha hydrolase (AANH) superfamily ATPase